MLKENFHCRKIVQSKR